MNDTMVPADGRFGQAAVFRAAALCGVVPLLALVFDIAMTMVFGASQTTDRTAAAWFGLFRENALLGLQGLSFPQFVTVALGIPFWLVLCLALRERGAALALVALALSLVGAAVFLSSNAALPMLALSERFAAAGSEAERGLLAAAGEAVLARGTDFTPAGCGSFVLQTFAGLLASVLMVGARGFGRWRGWLGLGGFVLLMVFILGASFVPGGFAVLMPVSMIGGLASMVWYVAVSASLWRLASTRPAGGAQ